MPEFFFKNNTDYKIDSLFKEQLETILSEWTKDNDISVYVYAQKSESDKLVVFKFDKKTWVRLEQGVSHNLLKADIDILLKKYKDDFLGKVQFQFFVGIDKQTLEKKMQNSKNNLKDSPKLSVFPTEPKYSLSQVILRKEVKKEIDGVIALLKNMKKIYYEWGFVDIDPVPRSIVNFWGPPGTGKTMTVHAIAKEMGKKILVLNYADIESKYVGEAPKNLISAFDLAEQEDAVIFFDEADSFLGKRITNVDSGSEQAINSLRSQMLMKLEAFNGIVFFATNLHENYDRAFESRILKHIEFKLPDTEARKQIIKSKLPPNAPYGVDVKNENGDFLEELLTKVAETIEGFSGREIKNCILELLIKASQAETPLITADLLTEVFMAKKAEADSLKKKGLERKEKLEGEIKKNLKSKNYRVKKLNKRR